MRCIKSAAFICLALHFAPIAAPDGRAGEPGTDLSPSPQPIAPTAGPDSRAGDNMVDTGIRAYHDGNFKSAAASFTEALKAAPQDSSLHHWLGKSYGRIAERGNWFKSMSYARKTLKQFRKAVELDGNNRDALRDLADYLVTAPRFLGGNKQEAERLRQRLERLQDTGAAANE